MLFRQQCGLTVQVEFWRKGASHEEEQRQRQQQSHEQEWLEHDRGGPVDTAQAAVDGSGDMMTQDMARCGSSLTV